MKKGLLGFAAPVAVALVLGLAVYAVPAMGTSTSLATRVAKLEKANKTIVAANARLAKQVAASTKAQKAATAASVKLTKRVSALEGFISCNQNVAPVTIQGDPTTGTGFEFTPDNKVTTTLMKGFIPTDTGQKADDYLQIVDADCVAASPSASKLGAFARTGH